MLAMGTAHLPAWQKLGLKLKNEFPKASQTSPTDEFNAGATSRKRKFSQELDADVDYPKGFKRQQQTAISIIPGASFNSLRASSTGSESHTSSDSRRKSVTFTADTKAEDGFSSKRLVQAAYASKLAQMDHGAGSVKGKLQNGHATRTKSKIATYASSVGQMENGIANATEETQNTMAAGDLDNDTTDNASQTPMPASSETEKSAQPKRLKKPSAQPSSKAEAAKQKKKQELAIQYLEQYANTRATWKFNKRRQMAVLKMVLEVEYIPMEYDEALKAYLAGLQSTASRQDLRSRAQQILAQESDTTDPISTDNAQASRAKLVLEALGEEATVLNLDSGTDVLGGMGLPTTATQPKPATTAMNGIQAHPELNTNASPKLDVNGATKKRKRRRVKKRRNASPASSDSDSSSSSSSGNESDDEESDRN